MAQPETLWESMSVGHTPQLESIVSFASATLLGLYYKKIMRDVMDIWTKLFVTVRN